MTDTNNPTPIDYATPTPPSPRLAWIDPIACGAVFATGVAMIAGWPSSFTNADDRIAAAGPIAAIVAAAGAALNGRRLTGKLVAMALFVAAALVATLPTLLPMGGRWSPLVFALVVAGVAFVALVDNYAILMLRRRDARGAASLVLLGMAAAAGGLAAMTGSVRIAEKTAPLAIALLLAAIVGAFVKNRRALPGIAAFGIAVTLSQLASAHLWSDLALWQAACVLVAPILAALAASIPFIKRRRPWLRATLIVLIAAMPATIASGIAGAEFARSQQSDRAGEYDSYY